MKSFSRKNLYLLMFSVAFSLALIEVVLHSFVKPSEQSFGKFLDMELPPYRILPPESQDPESERHNRVVKWWCDSSLKDGKKLTWGDFAGVMREDALIGYVPLENTKSRNSWWQSNNLGARSRNPTLKSVTPGTKRVLLFGESFINGSRLPQEETVQHYLENLEPSLEVINFSVDGYSMAQAYLRYQVLKTKLDHDIAILVFVPPADLWRDVNVSRKVGENWDSYMIYPRFVLEKGKLKLIPGPYKDLQALLDGNRHGVSPQLRNHLRQYDAFYSRALYEATPILDSSIMFKLYKRYYAINQREVLRNRLMDPQSEAMMITREIAKAMSDQVKGQGAQFSLLILPPIQSVKSFAEQGPYIERWRKMSDFMCSGDFNCLDLMDGFQTVQLHELDTVCDGWHFGPKTNKYLAKEILKSVLH